MNFKNILRAFINLFTLGFADAIQSKPVALLWCIPPLFFTVSSLNNDFLSPAIFEMKYWLFFVLFIALLGSSFFSHYSKKISYLILVPLLIASYVSAYYVPKKLGITLGIGTSMLPTIKSGEFVIYKDIDAQEPIDRGDIILFKLKSKNIEVEKRVFALGGSTVYAKDKQYCIAVKNICIKDNLLSDDYIRIFNIPKNTFFVLGDNIPLSSDSRHWKNPYVKRQDIYGKYIGKSYILNRFMHYFFD
ncbi:Peptidase S24-like protein [Vibrio aerogenes CECT 7868]|uniref:Signal peptidase I n=1 Tax=Vibrio aerogenes CECT 7868 TaxID=1216006 RepID=A0A1M5Y2J4_9VIBR|nr:signal peptidase I [Vibrio aerogenes]SHI06257.1 Peptidase S24-like protein [Vibrio aerogenes CECT 7868]